MENNDNLNEQEGYISYNGLNRPPLFCGVPILIFITLLATACFVVLPLTVYVSTILGGILGLVLLALFFVLKFSCEDDPNAVPYIKLKVRGFISYKFKKVLAVRGS